MHGHHGRFGHHPSCTCSSCAPEHHRHSSHHEHHEHHEMHGHQAHAPGCRCGACAARLPNAVTLHPNRREWEGKSRGVMLSSLPQRELDRGTQHEHEHSGSHWVARRTAADHLVEDPAYYAHLGTMERSHRRPNPADCGCGPHPARHHNPLSAKAKKLVGGERELARPAGLSPAGNKAYDTIVDFLVKHGMTYTGGSKAFYSPAEWAARGEEYARNAVLIVVYDGGELPYVFNMDRASEADNYQRMEALQKALRKSGLHAEESTHWYSGIYADEGAKRTSGARKKLPSRDRQHQPGEPVARRRSSRTADASQARIKAEVLRSIARRKGTSAETRAYLLKEATKYEQESKKVAQAHAEAAAMPMARRSPGKRKSAPKGRKSNPADKAVNAALRPAAKKMLGKACYQPSCFKEPKKASKPKALPGRAPLALPPHRSR
jgi:hypothetical protein